MLTIRLLRTGKKHQPSYKIVVTDKRNAPAGGRFVEEIGNYDPKTKVRNIKKERAQYWVSVGAQPSDTVHNMLVSDKVIDQPKRKIFFVKPEPAPVAEPVKAAAPVAEPVKAEEPVAEPAKVEEPAPVEEVAPTEEPAKVEASTEEPAIEAPVEEPAIEAPVEEPAIEAPTEEPAIETPAEKPAE